MPIQKRPLVTAARFPGIFQHGTNQGLTQGITSAFGNVSNAMIQNKIMEASAAKEASIRTTEEQARTFQFIAGLGDGKNVMKDDELKRAMLRNLAREAGNSGKDMTPYMDALAIDDPDELNLHLARVSTQLGAKPIKGVAIGKNERLANPLTGATMGPEPTAEPADLTAVQENLIAAGFTPGTKEFQDKLLELISRPIGTTVNVNSDGFKVPASHMKNPDFGKISEEYPEGDPRVVIPQAGSLADKSMKTHTAEQTQSATFASRMDKAEDIFSALRAEGFDPSSIAEHAAGDVPFGNYLRTPQGQKWFQAASDWVRAKLRKESGAVIGPEEMADEIALYFPQPGDGPDVIEQKRKSRLTAQDGMIGQSQGAYKPDYDEKKTITDADGKATVYYKRGDKWYTK